MRRIATAAALLAAGAAIGGGGAYAGTGITSSQIKNGTIQLSDLSPATIKALRGKAGPIGKTGPTGAAGAAGAAGPAGPAGVSALELVTGAPVSGTATATATCPAGKRVLGGGATNYGVSPIPALRRDAPASDLSGWYVNAESGGHVGDEVTAYAICAVVSA